MAACSRGGDLFDFLGGRGGRGGRPAPREEIEDFISDRANYYEAVSLVLGEVAVVLQDLPPARLSRKPSD
jgi:hypothetical protein